MVKKHTCSNEDHISKIAEKYNMRWDTIWNDPGNAALKRKRKNSNLLFKGDRRWKKGDVIIIPDKKKKKISKGIDLTHIFQFPQKPLDLLFRILKSDFTPIANAQYELTIEGCDTPFKGSTDGSGKIEAKKIPPKSSKGTLTVSVSPEDARQGGENAPEGAAEGPVPVTWKLYIGKLNSIMERAPDKWCISGVQQRLNNLNINCGPVDGINGGNTKAAVKKFQSRFGLTIDGLPGQGETQPKLMEVYDTASFTGPPPEDEAEVPPPKRVLETKENDIGHVAPCFPGNKIYNALVIRPQYRVSMTLGKIDDLCPEAETSDRGKEMRLQLMSFLYDPIKSSPALTDAFNHVWNWYSGAAPGGLGKTAANLKSDLNTEIVENGRIPVAGEFHKIFFPGGYCYNASDQNDALGGNIANVHVVKNPHPMYARATAMWDKNSVLGAIPIIVKVEQLVKDEWKPAANVDTYFQLQTPDDLPGNHIQPALRTAAPGHAQPGVQPVTDDSLQSATRWPGGYQKHMMSQKKASAGDPQVDNCHKAYGGKRGGNVSGKAPNAVLEIKTASNRYRRGIYRKHASRDIERTVFFNAPEKSKIVGDKHKNAIMAKTNADGEAGFIFRPSRTAGDRYKLKAYVGPKSLDSDGTGAGAAYAETGTFVVWHRMRIAKYLQWQHPGGFTTAANNNLATNMQNIDIAIVQNEFRRGFCETSLEASGARSTLSAAEWTRARNHAIGRLPNSVVVNYNEMFPSVNATPCMINIVDRATYNSNRNNGGGVWPSLNNIDWWNLASANVSRMINGIMHYFTREALPFVFLQAPFGDMMTLRGLVPNAYNDGNLTTSGVATRFRGCFLFGGSGYYNNWFYPSGISHNAVHEAGHCYYGGHQWTQAGPPRRGHLPEDHDGYDLCVMGYLHCDGDFCGRCLLKYRGWNTGALPAGNTQLGPRAKAGFNRVVAVGDTVTLNGSDSREMVNPVVFRWSITNKPPDSAASLSDTAAEQPTFTADKPGTYTVQLIVDNGTSASQPDTVTIIAKE